MGRTLYDKLWDDHVVHTEDDGTAVLYIDRHLVHEVTSPQAFEGLRVAGRKVWRVSSIVATADHNTPTTGWERGMDGITDPTSKEQVVTLDNNIREFGSAAYFPFLSKRRYPVLLPSLSTILQNRPLNPRLKTAKALSW